MLSLLQGEARPAEPLALVLPERRFSPAAAFCLSLLFPGLGHLYLGRRRTAAWTAAGFLLCAGCSVSEVPAVLGLFLIGVPALYVFAAADAFCAAREWNAGVADRLTGTNPRIATVLNALTKGFGYFYLGQRGKGIAVMAAMTILGQFTRTPWLAAAAMTLQLLIAADGYRIAKQALLAANPELAPRTEPEPLDPNRGAAQTALTDPVAAANRGTLSPVVVTAVLGLFGGLALFAVVTINLTNGRANRAPGIVEVDGDGLHYRNPGLGISLIAPEGWETQPPGQSLLRLQDGSCVLSVVDNTIFFGRTTFQQGIRTGLQKSYPNATFGPAAAWHGSAQRPEGMTITMIARDKVIHEDWFGLRHGSHLTSVFEAYPAENATCAPGFEAIERSLVVR